MTCETVDPAQCGSYLLHGAHSWREGFFFHLKKYCGGSSAIPMPNISVEQIRKILGLPAVSNEEEKV